MAILPVGQNSIYDHSNLINNPPAIPNNPLYDYLHENGMDSFAYKSDINTYSDWEKTNRFMSILYCATVGMFIAMLYSIYKTFKSFLVR